MRLITRVELKPVLIFIRRRAARPRKTRFLSVMSRKRPYHRPLLLFLKASVGDVERQTTIRPEAPGTAVSPSPKLQHGLPQPFQAN